MTILRPCYISRKRPSLTHLRTAPEGAPLGPDEHVLEVELDLIRYAHHRLEYDLHENPPNLPRKSGTKWPEHHGRTTTILAKDTGLFNRSQTLWQRGLEMNPRQASAPCPLEPSQGWPSATRPSPFSVKPQRKPSLGHPSDA